MTPWSNRTKMDDESMMCNKSKLLVLRMIVHMSREQMSDQKQITKVKLMKTELYKVTTFHITTI